MYLDKHLSWCIARNTSIFGWRQYCLRATPTESILPAANHNMMILATKPPTISLSGSLFPPIRYPGICGRFPEQTPLAILSQQRVYRDRECIPLPHAPSSSRACRSPSLPCVSVLTRYSHAHSSSLIAHPPDSNRPSTHGEPQLLAFNRCPYSHRWMTSSMFNSASRRWQQEEQPSIVSFSGLTSLSKVNLASAGQPDQLIQASKGNPCLHG